MLLNCGVGEDSFFSVPWTSRRSSQSFLKELNPEDSLEGVVLKLKFQYFGHLIQRADSLEKTRMLGRIEGRRRDDRWRNGWMASLTQWTWAWASSGRLRRTGKPGMMRFTGSQTVGHDWTTEQQIFSLTFHIDCPFFSICCAWERATCTLHLGLPWPRV